MEIQVGDDGNGTVFVGIDSFIAYVTLDILKMPDDAVVPRDQILEAMETYKNQVHHAHATQIAVGDSVDEPE